MLDSSQPRALPLSALSKLPIDPIDYRLLGFEGGMRRRDLIAALGGVAMWPVGARAQTSNVRPALIGWLSLRSRIPGSDADAWFKEGLSALGWREGTQFVLETRWANGQADRLQPLAEELAAMRPAIILAWPGIAVTAAAKAAPATPIVFATVDVVASGIVKNLAQPEGLITGISAMQSDTIAKQIDFLMSMTPQPRHVGVLDDSTGLASVRAAFGEEIRRAVARHSVAVSYEEVGRPEEIEPAIVRLAEAGSDALVVIPSTILQSQRQRILDLAALRRWPVTGWSGEWPRSGALLSYGINNQESFRRAAYFVDRILKGAKPRDLPVEQPTKVELIINMKTAKTLGVSVPLPLQAGANEVID